MNGDVIGVVWLIGVVCLEVCSGSSVHYGRVCNC